MIAAIRQANLPADEQRVLENKLADYYTRSPQAYYEVSEQGGADYSPDVLPFHCDLIRRVTPGMAVLELGCGSAHLCPHVQKAGGTYTGVDHGAALLENNRLRYPQARFLSIGTEFDEALDLVASLYTIEHVVDPPAYLARMWKACKPGGLLAVICPDFVDGAGIPPSFFFGATPRRLREKLKRFALADAAEHLIDLWWSAPRWKARARASSPGAFWINRKPKILHGAPYSVDADAVHLPRLTDLVWWLEKKGARILMTSRLMADVDPAVLRYNCYVVATKPSN
jgi:SAM-dependent methyltransferase